MEEALLKVGTHIWQKKGRGRYIVKKDTVVEIVRRYYVGSGAFEDRLVTDIRAKGSKSVFVVNTDDLRLESP